jgi:SPOR domain
MNKIFFLILLFGGKLFAQTDSPTVTVVKDPRLDQLVKKQAQINEATTRDSRRNVPGFRISVINSTDRNKVFAVKTKVYQQYPELKSYLTYQAPNYRLKVGNFKTEEEAQSYLSQLSKLFSSGVYIVHDVVEIKLDAPKEDAP